jgi:hypothetical protein
MRVKSLINEAERDFVISIKKQLEEDLKKHTEYDLDLNLDIEYIRIRAKIELCKKLLR